MQISSLTYAALSRERRCDFEHRLLLHLEKVAPDKFVGVPRGVMTSRITSTVDRALSYGIDDEGDVAGFAEFSFLLGDEFEKSPDYDWTMVVLTHPHMTGHAKVELIREELDGFDEE